jgi:hypothetical protein
MSIHNLKKNYKTCRELSKNPKFIELVNQLVINYTKENYDSLNLYVKEYFPHQTISIISDANFYLFISEAEFQDPRLLILTNNINVSFAFSCLYSQPSTIQIEDPFLQSITKHGYGYRIGLKSYGQTNGKSYSFVSKAVSAPDGLIKNAFVITVFEK